MNFSSTTRVLFVGSMLGFVICMLVLSSWLFLWPMWLEYRMRPAKATMPDRVLLGTVRVGATVDASVRVFTDLTDPSGVKAYCREPYFVAVRKTYVGGPSEGTARESVFCDVFFSIRAATPGEHSGSLRVFVGDQKVDIPISVNVLPPDSTLPRVLITETPFVRYATDDASIFEPLLERLKSANVDIHYAESLPDDITGFDVVVL